MLDSTLLVTPGVLVVPLVLLCVVLLVALLRNRARTRHELDAARAQTAALRHQIDEIERVLAASARPAPRGQAEYTITGLGRSDVGAEPVDPSAPQLDRALFADVVLRETVVRAVSLAHGVRRALSAETRNRVRFEVRREIKRARKQRRADTREARREWEARQRATVGDDNETAA